MLGFLTKKQTTGRSSKNVFNSSNSLPLSKRSLFHQKKLWFSKTVFH